MAWYYAGPETKPVGPVSLEELHARCAGAQLTPETYVIEHTGLPGAPMAWRRYREVFPAGPAQPFQPPPLPPVLPPQLPQPHPLFPSAAPAWTPPAHASHTAPPVASATNAWCVWGFGVGLGSLVLLPFTCGLSALLTVPAVALCLVGLVQVLGSRQHGRGWAVGGLGLSGVTLILLFFFLLWAVPLAIQHEQTTTEQSTSDAE